MKTPTAWHPAWWLLTLSAAIYRRTGWSRPFALCNELWVRCYPQQVDYLMPWQH